jgi:hypothetical protein
MALQKFRKELFMDRAFAPFQRRDFVFIVINQQNFMAKLSEAGARYEANIT